MVIGLALAACGSDAEQGSQPPTQQSDAGVIIGWIYDGEEGCLQEASPQVALVDSLVLDAQTPTLGPGGVCWVLPRSQLPREGWTEIDPFDLPDSCPDLMDIPYCGPFCPHDRFSGARYDQDRHCVEQAELWCRPVNAGGGDAITAALAPDGTCWQFPDTQMPGDDWIMAERSQCPERLFSAPACGVDAGIVDAGAVVDATVVDAATTIDAASPVSDGGD